MWLLTLANERTSRNLQDAVQQGDECLEMQAALVAANARPSLRIPQREREAFRGR